ncbi:uncharacterized protein LOC126691762 [Quercus robur]|uniref:uncharacterized protein LOC126691762 n=1 Tax=Quercus robur TaxID=38942 RepID=UPI0021637A76|nr:uncharacterized protein LOC126691762 [Quercus robur]XP_050242840.1 uncharacterized protein LOC126691762 [Quercus robur]XP_050242841.1 uncharacterized protein LOC126691762 [Quercus robur]XP_050242842.1 uncharacterized protein LOC126691762 [Quercus robur]XP_050242843.1 uncharacterized protein LOC126691762 [Quercus robur]XP_050242844.1 uncharacterized protein LOC126691762 [Quercus robur]XP_050242845.1 uncharacterized protein LOC126691762 [Quercus robur]XP_050242847.1 uncharacterized protein 
MAEKGEKTCPICAEEMDFTDQQLKPCKCGYQMCVWCWHHIMEMAEKDGTDGRCPACRAPYDKEKIVGMAANCERLVAERNLERKQKLQKSKPKAASEGRKHLNDVRVIQRNLVYIIGLPLNLADEDLLQHREYFGQYGKVMKVSISRTANGVIQHSSNNSCCVYITYSKEEEAARCIQSVHSFVLDGRSLRACFGTTKYCHAWLKNLPCSNSDCLYLHDYGSLEDSFTKDDLVSAFERSRIQQIIGATNNLHRRSGNVLPSPAFENANTSISTAKPVARSPSNYTSNEVRGPPADNGSGRSSVPPNAASWVMRVSTSLPPVTSISVSGPSNQNPDISDNSQVLPLDVMTERSTHDATKSMIDEESWEVHSNAKLKPIESTKQFVDGNCQVVESNTNAESILDSTRATVTSSKHFSHLLAAKGINQNIAAQSTSTSSLELIKPSYSPGFLKDGSIHADGNVQGLCSDLSSTNNHNHFKQNFSGSVGPEGDLTQTKGAQQDDKELSGEASMSTAFMEAALMEGLLGLDDQQPKDFKGIHQQPSISCSPCLYQNLNQPSCHFWQHGEVSKQSNVVQDPRIVCMKQEEDAYQLTSESTVSSNGFNDNKINILPDFGGTFGSSSVFSEKGLGNLGIYEKPVLGVNNSAESDIGESSIISNILSLDIDTSEDSLTSPHNLVKFLSETGKQHASIKVPNLQKAQDKNQSRFSFARQEDYLNHISDFENSLGSIRHVPNEYSTSRDFVEKKHPYIDTYEHNFSSGSFLESGRYPSSDPFTSSKLPVSRAPTSIPPGFSVPTKATPPGFPSHGRMEQAFDPSAYRLLQNSARTGISGFTEDVESIDPAILEVGKGILKRGLNNAGFNMRPTLSQQFSPFEQDPRLNMLMQQSISPQQNLGFPDNFGNRFSPPHDAYRFSPMLLDQVQPNNPSALLTAQQIGNMQMSNGHWGGWNEARNVSGLGISELLQNERMGCNKFIPVYEDGKFPMSTFSNLPNREFGM